MHIVFIEPSFPANQKQFVRALHEVGATVIGIGERPKDWLDDEVAAGSPTTSRCRRSSTRAGCIEVVRGLQQHVEIDRLEADGRGAHHGRGARPRGVRHPRHAVRTAFLCRDKPAMKEVLRDAGIRCAASTGARSGDEVREFAAAVGFPLVLKPPAGAGASGAERVNGPDELEAAIARSGVDHGRRVAVEEFVEGHEGFYDTITHRRRGGQRVRHALLPERARGDAHALDLAAVHRHQPHRRRPATTR